MRYDLSVLTCPRGLLFVFSGTAYRCLRRSRRQRPSRETANAAHPPLHAAAREQHCPDHEGARKEGQTAGGPMGV